MSTSTAMSSAAIAISAVSLAKANEAKEAAQDTLRLQCKVAYDPNICAEVCLSSSKTRVENKDWITAVYQKTTTNQCITENSITATYQGVRVETIFGLIIGTMFLGTVIYKFITD